MVRIGVLTKERDKARRSREELSRFVGRLHEAVLEAEDYFEVVKSCGMSFLFTTHSWRTEDMRVGSRH